MHVDRTSRFARAARLIRLVGGVLSAQTLAQLLMLVSGFLLLRWLSVAEYAQYTIAFAFVATLTTLIDLGFAGAVMPLVGDRARDARVLGEYLRAALHLRTRLASLLLPLGAIAFFVLTAHRGWGLGVQVGLFASVALGLLARAMVDIFSLPLLMNDAYRSFYVPQVSSSILRLGTHALLQLTRGLTSVSASLVNAVATLANGVAYRRSARARSDLPPRADPERVREIRRMAAPSMPGLVFYAFQGQITILLVAAFGRTESVAEVGALTRLGAVFVVLAALIQVLIAPRFPQIPSELLVRRVAEMIAATAAIGVALTTFAFLVPGPLLLLLGPEYHQLRLEVGWFMLGASLTFVAGVIYAMNLARRFIWWWPAVLGLGAILATQFVAAMLLDLGSPLELQYFAALTGLAACVAQAAALLFGLRRGPRAV